MNTLTSDITTPSGEHSIIIHDFNLDAINEEFIARHSLSGPSSERNSSHHIVAKLLDIDHGVFTSHFVNIHFPDVSVVKANGVLTLCCSCNANLNKLCEHQAQVLTALVRREEFRSFFDDKLRHEKIKIRAADYGMEHEPDLEAFFKATYENRKLVISPRDRSLIPVTGESLQVLRELVIPQTTNKHAEASADQVTCIVIKQHKFNKHLIIELCLAQITRDGKVKGALTPVNPSQKMWETADNDELKFFAAVSKFQSVTTQKIADSDIPALQAVVKNPSDFRFYYHNNRISENITARSVVPVKVKQVTGDIRLSISRSEQFYELTATLDLEGVAYFLKDLPVVFDFFILADDTLYLVNDLQTINLINFYKNKAESLLVHHTKYAEFKRRFLSKLEDNLVIQYTDVKPATATQLEANGFNKGPELIIYLSDFGQHVMIIPVVRYGDVEIQIRSKQQIFSFDEKGKEFVVLRDEALEERFMALLLKQHSHFEEQLQNRLQYLYLHKKYFLEESWFLNVFDELQWHKVTVFGFNELEGNKLNPNKIKITINVNSGVNWFNALVDVRFGKKKASLKHLHKTIRNKGKYVPLDDGTLGIIPHEWLAKFSAYFNAAETIDDDTLHISKINFAEVEQLFEQEMLDETVKTELNTYRIKLADFKSIKEIDVPAQLRAELRPYQRQGLNWLNFLDDFNFGGCLADDMGLGKSVQVIAFILSQRAKVKANTNLIVVPTSLIFNWETEIAKFAPAIKVHTISGAERTKSTDNFDRYEIVLTTYGTLLSDINYLKSFTFNYVFLDESQNIKNPESQRYKAARLLKSRNKIVITGTPVENNTIDLYGQLSFACPGLLGSKQFFKDVYAFPIDKFRDTKRAVELHEKIKPFILRRTKREVAKELPDKTEMVLYCEMGDEQRKIYDAYEREFRDYISAITNEELNKSSMNVLKGLTKLRQICDSPAILSGERLPGEASAKIDLLLEEINGKYPNHKILVFSQFVSMLELIKTELEKYGISYSYLTGATKNRSKVVNEFQTDAEKRVFLISLKAGGTGLNLTEADYVYLVDPWWNPAVENQAIDRAHRIGQHKNIVALRLICKDTVEEKIMKLQESKRDLANNLVDSGNSFIQSLSRSDLLKLLS